MSDGADVLPLFKGADDGENAHPVRTKGWKRHCRHKKVVLDREAPSVSCRSCGRVLDPYDVLDNIAREPERYIEALKEARRQTRVAEANLAELLREERNAKARKRRRER